jgi:hypothetical protein
MSEQLLPPQPPRLPDPGTAVDSRYMNALLSTLRLFFNQLQRVVALLTGPNGGRFIQNPFGAFYNSVNLAEGAAGVANIVFNSTGVANGIALVGTTGLVPASTGLYRVELQVFVQNLVATATYVNVWARVNGVTVPGTATSHAVATGHTLTNSFLLQLTGGDTLSFQIYFPTANIRLLSLGTDPTWGSTPINSTMALLTLVSAPVTP